MTNHYGIVFPGQGSQSVGMISGILSHPLVKDIFDEASGVLNYDLFQLVQVGPAKVLDKTYHTQPALLAASYAFWKVMQDRQNFMPALLAGHSLGEYTALVCANSLTFKDAIALVALRGQYMQEAVKEGEGAMAVIVGLNDAMVIEICQEVQTSSKEIVSAANFNSIGQVVIAGQKEAVNRAMILAKEKGAKLTVSLPVSVPSHCELMKPAAKRLAEKLATIQFEAPRIPVINNVDVKQYDTTESIRDGLTRQLYCPVRWVETIQLFIQKGVSHIIECGPGKVLTGLIKRIDKTLQLEALHDA